MQHSSATIAAASGGPVGASGRRRGRLELAGLLLLGLALGLHGRDYALVYDEIASTRFAATPLRLLWSDWMVNETNPPLYYSLLKLWIGLAGDSDAGIRILSTLIGLGGIACAWRLGRDFGGRGCGLIAGLLLAVSQQHVSYSQLARGYILGHSATLLALVGLAGLARSWNGASSRNAATGIAIYFAGAVVAVYSHTTLVLLPVLANVWALARYGDDWRRERLLPHHFVGWIGANLALLAIWAWWGYVTWLQSTQLVRNIGWIPKPSLAYAVRMTLESYIPWGLGPANLLSAALFAGLAGWGLWQNRSRGAGLLATLAVGAPLLLFGLSLIRPVFLPRTVYFGAGPFLIAVAAGVAALPGRWVLAGAAMALALEGAALRVWYSEREIEPWRALASTLAASGGEGPLIVKGAGPAFALQRYCPIRDCGRQLVILASPAVDHWSDGMARPAAIGPAGLPGALAGHCSFATLRWASDDPAFDLPPGAGRIGPAHTWGPGGSLGIASWTRSDPACPGGRPLDRAGEGG